MIDKAGVKMTRIATNAARDEGRQPSHDGEYLALYYVPGSGQWLLEGNAGVVATDDDPYPTSTEDDETWPEIIAEVEDDIARDRGEPATQCGAEASSMMQEMGWIQVDAEWPDETHTITR